MAARILHRKCLRISLHCDKIFSFILQLHVGAVRILDYKCKYYLAKTCDLSRKFAETHPTWPGVGEGVEEGCMLACVCVCASVCVWLHFCFCQTEYFSLGWRELGRDQCWCLGGSVLRSPQMSEWILYRSVIIVWDSWGSAMAFWTLLKKRKNKLNLLFSF